MRHQNQLALWGRRSFTYLVSGLSELTLEPVYQHVERGAIGEIITAIVCDVGRTNRSCNRVALHLGFEIFHQLQKPSAWIRLGAPLCISIARIGHAGRIAKRVADLVLDGGV